MFIENKEGKKEIDVMNHDWKEFLAPKKHFLEHSIFSGKSVWFPLVLSENRTINGKAQL